MKLNIGSGLKRPPGFVNIDKEPRTNPDFVCDLTAERWPFDDNTMEEGICSHVMEHIPNLPEPFFHFLREMYRVSKPGAVIHIAVPHPRNDLFLRDPTHMRPILPDMMVAFSRRQVAEEAARGNNLTPYYDLIGVNFDVGKAYYVLDERVKKLAPALTPDNFAHYEAHMNNIVFEIQFDLTAVKNG